MSSRLEPLGIKVILNWNNFSLQRNVDYFSFNYMLYLCNSRLHRDDSRGMQSFHLHCVRELTNDMIMRALFPFQWQGVMIHICSYMYDKVPWNGKQEYWTTSFKTGQFFWHAVQYLYFQQERSLGSSTASALARMPQKITYGHTLCTNR